MVAKKSDVALASLSVCVKCEWSHNYWGKIIKIICLPYIVHTIPICTFWVFMVTVQQFTTTMWQTAHNPPSWLTCMPFLWFSRQNVFVSLSTQSERAWHDKSIERRVCVCVNRKYNSQRANVQIVQPLHLSHSRKPERYFFLLLCALQPDTKHLLCQLQ